MSCTIPLSRASITRIAGHGLNGPSSSPVCASSAPRCNALDAAGFFVVESALTVDTKTSHSPREHLLRCGLSAFGFLFCQSPRHACRGLVSTVSEHEPEIKKQATRVVAFRKQKRTNIRKIWAVLASFDGRACPLMSGHLIHTRIRLDILRRLCMRRGGGVLTACVFANIVLCFRRLTSMREYVLTLRASCVFAASVCVPSIAHRWRFAGALERPRARGNRRAR